MYEILQQCRPIHFLFHWYKPGRMNYSHHIFVAPRLDSTFFHYIFFERPFLDIGLAREAFFWDVYVLFASFLAKEMAGLSQNSRTYSKWFITSFAAGYLTTFMFISFTIDIDIGNFLNLLAKYFTRWIKWTSFAVFLVWLIFAVFFSFFALLFQSDILFLKFIDSSF